MPGQRATKPKFNVSHNLSVQHQLNINLWQEYDPIADYWKLVNTTGNYKLIQQWVSENIIWE